MCGIILAINTSVELAGQMLEQIKHRGPDSLKLISFDEVHLGFARLAINDATHLGMQPFIQNGWFACVNGEICNARELTKDLDLDLKSDSDIELMLPLFLRMGPTFIHHLDGFYAGVLFHPKERRLLTLRGPLRKKPLWLARGTWGAAVVSEQKVVPPKSEFFEIPSGCSELNLDTFEITRLAVQKAPHHIPNRHKTYNLDPPRMVKQKLKSSIKKRLPVSNQRLGIFLSGGLDSSLLTVLSLKLHVNSSLYVLGDENSTDSQHALAFTEEMGMEKPCTVELPCENEISTLIHQAIYTLESVNPSVISNGLATMLVSRQMHKDGIRVAFGGEGADEVFSGYRWFEPGDEWRNFQKQLLDDMWFTELRRLDLASMAFGVEVRCPFLDYELIQYVSELNYSDFFGYKHSLPMNKMVLRKAAEGLLPQRIIDRPKESFDVGSGIRRLVVQYLTANGLSERETLEQKFSDVFPETLITKYHQSYPAFDAAIDQRGANHR